MPITGKLEITIKISEFPEAKTVENGWKSFEVNCDGQLISITVKPKIWKKLEDAQTSFPMWVAAITGKMGEPIDPTKAAAQQGGFVLLEPNIQVFEKKAKEPAAAS